VKFSCWVSLVIRFLSVFVLTALVFVLTLIFTVNTCIVLFLQLQSHARFGALLEIFACSASLSSSPSREAVSLLDFFFSFFFIFLSTVFFSWERAVTLDNGG